MTIENQPCDLVILVRDHRLVEELLERHVGERHPRRDHLLGAFGSYTRKPVAGPRWRRLGEQFAQIGEYIGGGTDDLAIDHADFPAPHLLRCFANLCRTDRQGYSSDPPCAADGTWPPTSRLRLVQRTKMADGKAYLISHRAEHKQHMESRVARSRGYRGQQHECTGRDEILRPQRSQMRLALYQGVDHIERFGQSRKAKKPAAAGEKVILIALIFIEILRKKQGTQKIVHRCVHANEEIEAIGPVLYLAQPKLPPPERNHVQERPGDPAQVYRPDPVPTGVLDQCRDAADQTRDAEPEYQGDQHAHVKIEIQIGRQGRTLSHQSQFSLTIEA